MFRPRVIPVLLLNKDHLVKSRKFKDYRYIGDPINAVRIFNELLADELVFLDISATKNNRTISLDLIKDIGEEANMPFCVGGGIRELSQIQDIISAGAEKVIIGSYAVVNPDFVKQAASEFGSSTITVCIDVKKKFLGKEQVWTVNGTKASGFDPLSFAQLMEKNGAGEIIVQSIEHDGMMDGYDLALTKSIADTINIPTVALGGAGNINDLKKACQDANATGLAAGSLFVYYGPNKGVLINYPEKKNCSFNMNEKKAYQQCVRCVMDTTDPEIQFDEQGICNHCTDFLLRREEVKAVKKLGTEHLDTIINIIKEKGKGKKYDALLGISGGVDSCYAAWLLKQQGIRTLLVHMDNGWNSDDATINIKKIAKTLEFDYESYVLDWEEFKDIQLAFLKASVPEAETPTDVAIQGALHRVAAKNKISFIISGGNLATEGILPKFWHYNARDTKYFNHIINKFGTRKVKLFPNFGFKTEIYYKFVKGVKIVYLLNFIDYNKEKAMQLLQEELGWKYYGGKHHESRFTKFVQSYLLPNKFDLDYRKATFSSQICAGEMTREEAIEALKAPIYDEADMEKEKDYISKKLSITKEELNRIIALPGKYYYEYPNDEKRLNFIYNTYRKYYSG